MGGSDATLFAWLMKFDPNYQVIPWLAERYEVTPKGDVYTFYLRPGLKWSNGDAVTAHDFVWSYQRKLDPAVAADYVGFFYDLKNAEKINKGAITRPVTTGGAGQGRSDRGVHPGRAPRLFPCPDGLCCHSAVAPRHGGEARGQMDRAGAYRQ